MPIVGMYLFKHKRKWINLYSRHVLQRWKSTGASWLDVPASPEPTAKALIFRIAQYNILARNLATASHFPYVLESVLDWNVRKVRLVEQLELLESDVLCLEELTDYWTFFRSELCERGYDSVYVQRPSLNPSNWSGMKKEDGVGIFYRSSKFKLLTSEVVNYQDTHDRVALLVRLEVRGTGRELVLAATHIWWNAKKVDHQMAQVKELESAIREFTRASALACVPVRSHR